MARKCVRCQDSITHNYAHPLCVGCYPLVINKDWPKKGWKESPERKVFLMISDKYGEFNELTDVAFAMWYKGVQK